MNNQAIFEIGNLIHIRKKFKGFKLVDMTPEEIINTYEYQLFKKKFPTLCKLAEESE